MKSDRQEENFWVKLLQEPGGHDFWNQYVKKEYETNVGYFLFDKKIKELWNSIPETCHRPTEQQNRFQDANGKPPEWTKDTDPFTRSFMDFSNMEFEEDISFAGRVLIGADFSNTIFNGIVDFGGTVFLGQANFDGAKLPVEIPTEKASWYLDLVSFRRATFAHGVSFQGVCFPSGTWFYETRINSSARFQKAIFGKGSDWGRVSFSKSKFRGGSDFTKTVFYSSVNFDNTNFGWKADFSEAKFHGNADFNTAEFKDTITFFKSRFKKIADFNNTNFRDTISFQEASFGQPPKFFNTKVHEDMNFTGIDWNGAKWFYSRARNRLTQIMSKQEKPAKRNEYIRSKLRTYRKNDKSNTIEEEANDAINAIRAWERLALIMSKQEKPEERHVFFRLKMHAQRQRDGRSLLTIVNGVFEVLSDYGWSISRSLFWWSLHIFFGAVILATVACSQINGGDWVALLKMFWQSLLVSFSNSVAFLGLGSEGGFLYPLVCELMESSDQMKFLLPAVGTVQAVLGPILLFLVLLTLRNRFRLK